jgi:uncharacterized membrane protein
MSNHRIVTCIVISIAFLLLMPILIVQCQEYYIYNIEVRSDCSAIWTITQFSSADASVQSWESFQQKVYSLVESAASVTNRPMDIDESSLQINTTLSMESKITEYTFVWRNFSTIQNGELTFGDVFKTPNFFSLLFGDAALQLKYPNTYRPESVYPPPYDRQDENQLLKWARTQDLTNADTKGTLSASGQSDAHNNAIGIDVIGGGVVAVAVPVAVVGFYAARKRKNTKPSTPKAFDPTGLESDEDKILTLLKTVGGSMRQTEITEHLGYSKAKTSQLLTALEERGLLARYKRGRDKIVTTRGENT